MHQLTRFLLATTVLLCGALGPCSVAIADELDVYESLADIHIGRVFLSPQERARLDAGAPPIVRENETTPAPVVKRNSRPAGYFVSSTGAAGIWSRQGFVTEEDVDAVVFPGAVKIVRTPDADDSGTTGDDD